MTLPLILVVDDRYATDDFERNYFLNQTGLVERKDAQNDEPPPDAVGSAVFCSGQREGQPIEGDAYTANDVEVVQTAIQECGADRLSLILIDVQFDLPSNDAREGEANPGDRFLNPMHSSNFGFFLKNHLMEHVHDCPPIIMMSAHRQDGELHSGHSAHVVRKDTLSPKRMINILHDKGQINDRQRARLDLVALVWHIRTIRIDDTDVAKGMLPVIDHACNELKAAMLGAALTKEGKNRTRAARFIYGCDMGATLGTRDFCKMAKGVESVLSVNGLDANARQADNAIFNKRDLTDRGIDALLAKWEKWKDNYKWIEWRKQWRKLWENRR